MNDLFDEFENAHYLYDLENELLYDEQEKYFLDVQNVYNAILQELCHIKILAKVKVIDKTTKDLLQTLSMSFIETLMIAQEKEIDVVCDVDVVC